MTETTITIANSYGMFPFKRGDPVAVGGTGEVYLVRAVSSHHTLTVVPYRWYWRLWIGLTIDWQRLADRIAALLPPETPQ